MANSKPKNEIPDDADMPDGGVGAGPVEDFSEPQLDEPEAEEAAVEEAPEEKSDAKEKVSAEQTKMTKMIGVKAADVLAYNPETHRLVTAQGGKYQMTADGRLLHLMGPKPASLIKAEEAGEA